MPQRVAVGGVKRDQISGPIAGEQEFAGGRQKSGTAAVFPLMTPLHLACFVVDRLDHRLTPAAAIVAAPAFGLVTRVVNIINAKRTCRADIEKTGVRVVSRGRPVRGAALVRRDQRAVELR